MPAIKSSADLRNNYNEISTFCHNYPEPVFITKNGKGDLAVMSIEAYEELTSRFELYSQIKWMPCADLCLPGCRYLAASGQNGI